MVDNSKVLKDVTD